MQLGPCVADEKGYFHRSLLILLPQMMQKLRRHTSELERGGAGHKYILFYTLRAPITDFVV